MLETVNSLLGWGGAKLHGGWSGSLRKILTELQGLKTSVVTGTTSATNIAVTGIKTEDTLQSVVGIDGDAAVLADSVIDLTSEASITSNGNIQCSTTNTSAYRLIVNWWDKEA